MYGMVNQAVKGMITDNLGKETWMEFCHKLKLDPSGFSAFAQYDDKVTADLVGLVCEKTNLPAATVLEDFGKYWISYAKKSEYKSVLTSFASSPIELIESLDSLHSRLQLSFEHLKAPSFWVTRLSDREIKVHYKSQRDMGLEHFVVGLLKGIFDLFEQKCQVQMGEATHSESAVFLVQY